MDYYLLIIMDNNQYINYRQCVILELLLTYSKAIYILLWEHSLEK